MKRGTYVLIIFLVFIILAVATVISFLYFEFGRPPAVKANSYLEIKLSGALQEKAAPDFLTRMLTGAPSLSVHDLWRNFRKAKADSRIRNILIKLGHLECDWAKAKEIRDCILDFRKSGKKAYAYLEEALEFDKEYYLATACDRVILHPLGTLVVNGIGGYVPFAKKALNKMGVEAEFEQVEEYKTAASIFTEEGFTPAHREMMASIYGNLFSLYVKTLAEARGKAEEEVKSIIDQAFFQGEKALEAGLVDELLFEDELENILKDEGKTLTKTSLEEYEKIKTSSLGLDKGKKLALIYGMGPIHTGEGTYQSMGSDTVARWIRKARKDSSIKAVVFRVDSPGGSAVASDVIWREVILTKKKKPVVVSMSDVAGSGGYWVAMGASKIVAQPQTLTGSIGVLSGKFNLARLYEKLGLTGERLAYGKRADMFSTFRALTAEEREQLKKEIVWIYDRFVAKVAEGRNLSQEEVDKIGKGRVWTGVQAKDLGLVDEMGGLSRAVELAKELAGLPAEEEVRLVVWPRKISFFDILFGRKIQGQIQNPVANPTRILDLVKLLEKERVLALMSLWPLD